MSVLKQLDEAAAVVRKRMRSAPVVGVVLGSGLGAWGDELEDLVKLPYAEIPNMPVSTVPGHPGNLCIGKSGGNVVACLQGRAHLYEGHTAERVTFGVRLLARLGCRSVLLTNAAGAVRPALPPGNFMLVKDHINLTCTNPLVGENEETLGLRFPDMTHAYDPRLAALARDAASEVGLTLHEGVYAALLGPSYETPAEIGMLRALGADAVGMSTVPEVIALRHMRVRAAAISCITNLAAGLSPTALHHSEVEETAMRSHDRFVALLTAWVSRVAVAALGPPSSHGELA
jgi:purine-nucleoside phosphorylase